MDVIYDVIITGAGPAGLVAGLYTSWAKLSTLILEKEVLGGELMNRDLIENYPSYADGIMGSELGSAFLSQAIKWGAEMRLDEVKQVEIDGNRKVIKASQGKLFGQRDNYRGRCSPQEVERTRWAR